MKGRELIVITRYTSAPDKYNDLFSDATARLKGLGVDVEIDSLEGYFMHLRDLVYGPNDSLIDNPEEIEKGYPFLKLPLDEPHLKIDANTRTINTKDFTGVLSVQGDEIAEIVFFEIDRYFDAADFAQMQIAIQWKNKEEDGSTPAFIRIIEPSPDGEDEKLIFGWPITSDITRVPGAVQFSVRFYDRNDDTEEMNYSFVTLPTTMNIGASLTTDLDEDSMDDPRPVILSRLRNSTTLSQLDQAKAPIFVLHRPLSQEVDLGKETAYDLRAVARKNGSGGTISYKWYKAEIDEDGSPGEYVSIDTSNDPWKSAGIEDKNYYEVTEWIDKLSTYYYQKTLENGEIEYESLSLINADSFNTELKKRGKLFVRTSVLTVEIKPGESILGYYRVDARVSSVGTYAYASYAEGVTPDENYIGSVDTPTWVIKGPEVVVLDDIPEYGNVNSSIELTGVNLDTTTSYEWLYCANEDFASSVVETAGTGKSQILTKEGYYKAIATNYKNGASNNDETSVITSLAPIEEWGIVVTKEGRTFTASLNRDLGFKEEVSYTWFVANNSDEVLSNENVCTIEAGSPISAIQVSAIVTKGNLTSGPITKAEAVE